MLHYSLLRQWPVSAQENQEVRELVRQERVLSTYKDQFLAQLHPNLTTHNPLSSLTPLRTHFSYLLDILK